MRIGLRLLAVTTFFAGLAGTPALAQQMPETCQKEFVPLMQKRQTIINRIEGYKKRKPTAAQACGTFKELSGHNKKISEWMTAQQAWCQIPDEMLKQVNDAQGQIDQTRGNVCGAAAKQAQQLKQMQRMQRQQAAQPAPGAGVRLPQGAL
jgi:hypothetical protein